MSERIETRPSVLGPTDTFAERHLGPREVDVQAMLEQVGRSSLDELVAAVVPADIRLERELALGEPRGEHELLVELKTLARRNQLLRSYIGMGYHDCITPPVIQRNVLEDPGWYTPYTPYQAEVAQGRLEALLNFQTMVADLTGLPLANASLLDESTAAAEAMTMCRAIAGRERSVFFADRDCHPQTLAVLATRARPLGIRLEVGEVAGLDFATLQLCGVLVQYPTTHGAVRDYAPLARAAREAGALTVVAADPLALVLLRPPGEFGADIAVGSTQRFGVPLGCGGPHAAYLATREEYKRQVPGRIVGVARDDAGRRALRLAMQTREQHIRRERATSNICTAQVLLAVMASMYAVYHGPEGLRRIARRVHGLAALLAAGLKRLGHDVGHEPYFDTLRVRLAQPAAGELHGRAVAAGFNLRRYDDPRAVGVALDETVCLADIRALLEVFAGPAGLSFDLGELEEHADPAYRAPLARSTPPLAHPVFERYHSEHEMLRYLTRLRGRDLSLANSMIPLGSCTMKLNGTTLMLPVTWPEFARIHPFAPAEQRRGYAELTEGLERWLAEITGLAAVSLQPNSGAQGELAGLLVIRAYHERRGEGARDVCLIPTSAHGTNPASAVMAGMRVVPVDCDARGNVDLADLESKAATHASRLAAAMVTYPSTHGVFEPGIRRIVEIVHGHGGQVYLDGANMNAQVGLCRPGDYGADVCHINLHKTFCIPHGGGGPGMGPIAVGAHLAPFLPGHPLEGGRSEHAIGPIAAAPWGSAGILPISWTYIALMGGSGLARASQLAILNANYLARRLAGHYPLLYTGKGGSVAHEFILDARPFRESADVTFDDIAKRLMDFGIHAPTVSFPVAGTLMIEPTESESREELDRFCEAMIAIREEIRAIEEGRADRRDNALKRAPHTAESLVADAWDRAYPREQAAYPLAWVRERKFWPVVGRIDNAWGDRNLVCTCGTVEDYA